MSVETGTLPPERVRSMFDRIAPVYDAMNRIMTAGLDQRWRRITAESAVRSGDRVLDACCGTGDLALAAHARGGRVTGLDFSERMLQRARRKGSAIEWVEGDVLALPFPDSGFDAATVGFGVRNVDDLGQALRELRRVLVPGGRLAILEITTPRGALAPFYRLWFDRIVPLLGKVLPGGQAYEYLPASVRRFPVPDDLAAQLARGRLRRGVLPSLRRWHRRPPLRGRGVTTLATIRETPGLEAYLDTLEERLGEAVASHPGLVSAVGSEALAAGGKRLRPLLVFLCTPDGEEPAVEAGVAVELVHMATLVHDDLIDRAEFRRGKASAWTRHGPSVARATGDYLFACAFAELAATGDAEAVAVLADAALCLARGEAMQRAQTRDPDTTVEAYLERCALKTGKLFEAACRLGGGPGEFGLALGIAFQIADDILDCAGETVETGKIAGTDLREGTPTLPLLLAAREDPVVRQALAGGPLDGALLRVARTSALDRSRAIAADYAASARACLNGSLRREELESLTHAVVNRHS